MPPTIIAPSGLANGPRIEDYFGIWATTEESFLNAWNFFQSIDIAAHIANQAITDPASRSYSTPVSGPEGQNIAKISLRGQLMKAESSLMNSTSTVAVRREIRKIKADPAIDGVLFQFETPGGTVAGNMELADEMAALAAVKPTIGFIDDLCASAGVWLASQLPKLIINRAGLYGSIGTLLIVQDFSGKAQKEGIKVHVLKRGKYKAIGVPGTEVTQEQLSHLDAIVGNFDTLFKESVSRGRRISLDTINSLEAKVFPAAEAVSLGLVDSVGTYEDALLQLCGSIRKPSKARKASQEKLSMNLDDKATLADLRKLCPGATADFLLEMVESEKTIGESLTAYNAAQAKRLKDAEVSIAQRDAAAAKAAESASATSSTQDEPAPKAKGVKTSVKETPSDSQSETPSQVFDTLVRQYMNEHPNVTRHEAIVKVAARNPVAHRDFVMSQPGNDRRPIKDKIEDRFDQSEKMRRGEHLKV